MDYKAILKMVQQQFPEMSYRDAQKKAKEKYAEFKTQAELQKDGQPPVKVREKYDPAEFKADKTEGFQANPNEIPASELIAAEKRIKDLGVDRNNIIRVGKEIMPQGELVKHQKVGDNTFVTFEDAHGNKLPTSGFWKIWI